MTAPKRRYESSPSPMRRVSHGKPPGTGKRHPSKPLVPLGNHHDGPTLVMLTVGGPSQMSNDLVTQWLRRASGARVNFCAIQAGAAARSDGLTELLLANVPQDAILYVVQRDVDVPRDELQDVLDVLSDLEIPLARTQPLIANGYGDQFFIPDVCRMGGYAEDEAAPVNPLPKCSATGLFPVDRQKVLAGPAFEATASAMALRDQRELERDVVATLQNAIAEMGGDLRPSTREGIVKAFNQLQCARHWRWDSGAAGLHGTAGVKVLRQILKDLSMDQVAQHKLEGPLIQLFAVMGADHAACQAVLDAAATLDTYTRSVTAVLSLHVACMEHLVGSGAADRATALEYALRVYRCDEVGRSTSASWKRYAERHMTT